jgi:hypothetical protein
MKFGLSYSTAVAGTDPANLRAIARHADDLGFESFYVPEHITLYPGARVYEVESAPDLPIADPLECLAFVAASTTTILLATGVLLLPFHHPMVLAKRLATIDVLSSTRMRLLTIGVPGDVSRRPHRAVPQLARSVTSPSRSGAGMRATAAQTSAPKLNETRQRGYVGATRGWHGGVPYSWTVG